MTQATAHAIEVDTNSADNSKGVTRVAPDETRGGGVNADSNDKDAKLDSWFDKNKYVAKRMNRFAKNLSREFDQKLADEQARHQREMRELSAKLDGINTKSEVANTDAAHEAKIAELQAELEAAIESGNSKEQARLQTLIARTEAAHTEKRTTALLGGTQRRTDQQTQAEPVTARVPDTNTKAGQFIQSKPWWDNEEFEAEQAYANSLFVKLTKREGMDPEDPKVYERINKQLVTKFPDLKTREEELGDDDLDMDGNSHDDTDPEVTIEDTKPRARAPVSNFKDRGRNGGGNQAGKIKLDANDLQTMRAMKLDVNDNNAVMAFARAKRERIEAEG